MNKLLTLFLIFSILMGCENINNSPTKRVEDFLNKYQLLDEKNLYREIMKKQYRDLTYVIKDEEIDGDNASVKVEIEVYDYNKSISEASDYFITYQDEFLDEAGNVLKSKYIDYKLKLMKDNTLRIKYTLTFTLTKKNNKWILDEISDSDREKIHGMYSYYIKGLYNPFFML